MKQVVLAMIMVIAMLTLYGCTTAHFMKAGSTTYPPYNGDVKILEVPPEGVNYELIGIVSVNGPWDTGYDKLLQLMKTEAAQNGADAIMMCSNKVCPQLGNQGSSLAAPAMKILPKAEKEVVPPAIAPEPVPAAITEKALVEKGRATLNIQFDTNMAVVKDQYMGELAELADIMRKYPHLRVLIEGHTDSVGNDDLNMNLSQKRADSVKNNLLTIFGIDASRLDAQGYGETRPIEDNDTEEGRQKNRRVEAAVEYEKTVE
ncbi:MAG TPA: OmpA family protein [Desulfomonilia bacterium]|nr:OmpA family protein [Desulfomonilia bacterium]